MAENDGGVCCIGTKCEPSDPATCQQAGGDYNRPGIGFCFITQIWGDYLNDEHAKDLLVRLMVGGTAFMLTDARDEILLRWELGRKAVHLYRKHGPEALTLTRDSRELRRHVLITFFKLASFSRTLLNYLRTGDKNSVGKARYPGSLHKELIALVYRLDAAGASPEFVATLNSLLTDIEQLVDLTVPEFFKTIGIMVTPKAGSPPSRKPPKSR